MQEERKINRPGNGSDRRVVKKKEREWEGKEKESRKGEGEGDEILQKEGGDGSMGAAMRSAFN